MGNKYNGKGEPLSNLMRLSLANFLWPLTEKTRFITVPPEYDVFRIPVSVEPQCIEDLEFPTSFDETYEMHRTEQTIGELFIFYADYNKEHDVVVYFEEEI